MASMLSSFAMQLRLKKQLKRISTQPKDYQNNFQSLLIICTEKHLNNQELFLKFAEQFGISPVRITVIVLSNKEILETVETSIQTHIFSKKSVDFFGKLPDSLRQLFEKKFDLQINFFNSSIVFTDLVSASFNSSLRVGFSKSNHQLNDLILDIDLNEQDLFLKETNTYLKAILN
jgi:mannose/fructose-specific phosphotransferase system component IIA